MSPDKVSWRNMVAAWVAAGAGCVSALVTAVACVFAYFAWRTSQGQLDELKKGAKKEKKRIATEHVAAVITDLTTGDVASARDVVMSVGKQYAKVLPPNAPSSVGGMRRGDSLVDGELETAEQRQAVFMALWALQRASTVTEDLKYVDASIRQILSHHVGEMVSALNLLGKHLMDDERDAFAESAAAARTGVVALQKPLHYWFGGPQGPLSSLQVEFPVVEAPSEAESKQITANPGPEVDET